MYFCNMDSKFAITTLDSTKTTIKVKVGDYEYEMLLNKFITNLNIPAAYTAPYKSYTATLFQAGTFAPTPTVINNDFTGVTFTWSYVATGIYRITADSPIFTTNKTAIFFQNDYANLISWVVQINSTSQIQISNAEWTGTFPAQVDSAMQAAPFEIRVYN